MRKDVPALTKALTEEEFIKLIPELFQSVVIGTVDEKGDPWTSVIDIELSHGKKLFFTTANGKKLYQRLIHHPRVSLTALRGEETMSSVAFTLTGIAKEEKDSYIDEIFSLHPEMNTISGENPTERRALLRAFSIVPLEGSIYDLRQHPIFQKSFVF